MSEMKTLKISVPALLFDSCDVTQCLKNIAALSSWWLSSPSTLLVFYLTWKRNLPFTSRHGRAFQKTWKFITTTVSNSNLALRKFISRYLNHQQIIQEKWLNAMNRTVRIPITLRNVLSLHLHVGLHTVWITHGIDSTTDKICTENRLFQPIIWKKQYSKLLKNPCTLKIQGNRQCTL